jgi:hypothetical protein
VLPPTAQLPFCATHLVVLAERRWDAIPDPVLFRHHEDDWSLFQSLATPGSGRRGSGYRADWLAVHTPTGVTRWFLQTEETAVWPALLREPRPVISAPRPPAWGQTAPPFSHTPLRPEVAADMLAEVQRAFAEQVGTTPVPLYGPPTPLRGLRFRSYGSEGLGDQLQITSLEFADQPAVNAEPTRTAQVLMKERNALMDPLWAQLKNKTRMVAPRIYVGPDPPPKPRPAPPPATQALGYQTRYMLTYDISPDEGMDRTWQMRTRMDPFAPRLFAGLPEPVRALLGSPQAQSLCLQTFNMMQSYAPDRLNAIAAAPVAVHQHPLMIAGKEFTGPLLGWGGPYPLVAFALDHPEVGPVALRLEGAAYGIPLVDLLAVLEAFVVINDRPDLVAQYQQDFGDYQRSLFPF